jgi:hypothetical protein
LSARPDEGFAFDAYEESRSSSPPWCRRRPALLEDDEGSLSRGQEEKLYDDYTASATTPPREARPGPPQRIWVRRRAPRPLADTLTDRTTRPHDDREVTTRAAVTPAPISRWP